MVLLILVFGLQNEDIIRKCYNQQLADAIAVIKGMYKVGFLGCTGRGQLSILGVPRAGLPSLCFANVKNVQTCR